MIWYIQQVKKQFRDAYGFTPNANSTREEPNFDSIPDGEYEMVIGGKKDYVRVKNGAINCCNDKPTDKHYGC